MSTLGSSVDSPTLDTSVGCLVGSVHIREKPSALSSTIPGIYSMMTRPWSLRANLRSLGFSSEDALPDVRARLGRWSVFTLTTLPKRYTSKWSTAAITASAFFSDRVSQLGPRRPWEKKATTGNSTSSHTTCRQAPMAHSLASVYKTYSSSGIGTQKHILRQKDTFNTLNADSHSLVQTSLSDDPFPVSSISTEAAKSWTNFCSTPLCPGTASAAALS